MNNLFKQLKRWWKRWLFGEGLRPAWLSLDESVERLSKRGLSAFDDCLNVPVVTFFGVFDGSKVVVQAFRRDDVDVRFIQGLGPSIAKHAADFLGEIK